MANWAGVRTIALSFPEPGMQIRVDVIDPEELRERLEDAWLIQAPKRLASAYLEGRDG